MSSCQTSLHKEQNNNNQSKSNDIRTTNEQNDVSWGFKDEIKDIKLEPKFKKQQTTASSLGLSSFNCATGELFFRTEAKNQKKRSKEIDKQLNELAKQEKDVNKILLLGSGESGKSTLVKQMKIIHSDGFSDDELKSFKPIILDNLVSSMKYVLVGMSLLKISLGCPTNKHYAQRIISCPPIQEEDFFLFYPKIPFALKKLWNDKGVRLAVSKGYQYDLNDSALYFFENMKRICCEKYKPSSMDVLRARIKTVGVIETQFKVNDVSIRMIDVSGQKSKRRKWIQCFDDVKSLFFVAALSSYDSILKHNVNQNRLSESLDLFAEMINNKYFWNTSTLLFLNKMDLFREKVLYTNRHVRQYFPEFKGQDHNVDSAALFFQNKFESLNKNRNKVIHTHFTTATDTSNIQGVFQSVVETILRENVKKSTLL